MITYTQEEMIERNKNDNFYKYAKHIVFDKDDEGLTEFDKMRRLYKSGDYCSVFVGNETGLKAKMGFKRLLKQAEHFESVILSHCSIGNGEFDENRIFGIHFIPLLISFPDYFLRDFICFIRHAENKYESKENNSDENNTL